MKTTSLKAFAGIAFFSLAAVGSAQAADPITWGKYSVPPYMILDGENAQQGVFDSTLRVLKDQLVNYEHKEVQAPFPRIMTEVKDGAHWCFNGAIKTPEREAFAYFSLPASIFMPLKVIVRKDSAAALQGPQSLEALLQNRKLRTSVMRNRAYSPAIDKLLLAHPPTENYSEQAEAVGMLLAGRIDYMIELPLLALDQARKMGHPDELMALPTVESGEMVYNRVMCAKNEWGRKVVEQADAVLRSERGKPYYRKIVEKWHDAGSVTDIRKIYDTVFLKLP